MPHVRYNKSSKQLPVDRKRELCKKGRIKKAGAKNFRLQSNFFQQEFYFNHSSAESRGIAGGGGGGGVEKQQSTRKNSGIKKGVRETILAHNDRKNFPKRNDLSVLNSKGSTEPK